MILNIKKYLHRINFLHYLCYNKLYTYGHNKFKYYNRLRLNYLDVTLVRGGSMAICGKKLLFTNALETANVISLPL